MRNRLTCTKDLVHTEAYTQAFWMVTTAYAACHFNFKRFLIKIFLALNLFKELSHVLLDFVLKICLQADRRYYLNIT